MTHKKTIMQTTPEILNQFYNERNSSTNTRYAYRQTVHVFEEYTHTKIGYIMYMARLEEEKKTPWRNSTLRTHLINFRRYLYESYSKNSAHMHFSRIKAILRHYEIPIGELPYYSTRQAKPDIPINPDKLVDRDILKLCINQKNPLLRAIVLFMSSSGMSKIDTLNLKVKNYMEATYDYHRTNNITNMLYILKDRDDTVGTWNDYTRQKTGTTYFTFNSPESNKAIAQYLLTRRNLTLDSELFKISYKYMTDLFKTVNDELGLGKNGRYSRFQSHMLRRYHATRLMESGMSVDKVDLLQGRQPHSIAYKSYIKLKPSRLRDEFIQALPYLVIEDYTKVKTELEQTKDQLEAVSNENMILHNNLDSIWNELNNIKERQAIWEDLKRV